MPAKQDQPKGNSHRTKGKKVDRSRTSIYNIDLAESLSSRFSNISDFFGNWASQELQKARQTQKCHIFWAYLGSPHGSMFAEKINRLLEILLQLAPQERHRLRKKITQATNQPEFEAALFELEVASLLLMNGHKIKVEPLYPNKGPDFKMVLLSWDIYVEAKKFQPDAEESRLWKTKDHWVRVRSQLDLDKRAWNLRSRYFVASQFPKDGLHILVIDTSKSPGADRLLKGEWADYSRTSTSKDLSRRSIDCLILCRREKQEHTWWLNDLTAGADVLPNTSLPNSILDDLKNIFR